MNSPKHGTIPGKEKLMAAPRTKMCTWCYQLA